jgi:hypothetical protein
MRGASRSERSSRDNGTDTSGPFQLNATSEARTATGRTTAASCFLVERLAVIERVSMR